MSVPALARARRADATVPSSAAASPGRSTAPVRIPSSATAAGASAERAVRTNGAKAAKRRRHHLGFVLFAAVLVGLLVLGLVTLNAFVAQSSFRIDRLQARVDEQAERYLALERQAAHLSAPGRIAAWAGRHAMHTPDEVSVLHVSGPRAPGAGGTPAGGSTAVAVDRLTLRPIVEGGG